MQFATREEYDAFQAGLSAMRRLDSAANSDGQNDKLTDVMGIGSDPNSLTVTIHYRCDEGDDSDARRLLSELLDLIGPLYEKVLPDLDDTSFDPLDVLEELLSATEPVRDQLPGSGYREWGRISAAAADLRDPAEL
jgi:hypothetical protein